MANKFNEFDFLGDKISKIRKQRGLSQLQLAGKACVSPSALCKMESNITTPSLPALGRIAKVLSVSLSSLFLEDGSSFHGFALLRDDDQSFISDLVHNPLVLTALRNKLIKLALEKGLGDDDE